MTPQETMPLLASLNLSSARAVVVAGPVPEPLLRALAGQRGGAALVFTGEHQGLASELVRAGAPMVAVEPGHGELGLGSLAIKAPQTVDRLVVAGRACALEKTLVRPGGLILRLEHEMWRVERVPLGGA